MHLLEVHFNFPGSGAIPLRRNGDPGTVIQAPEWRAGEAPMPAAYAIATAPDPVIVRVRFGGGPSNGTMKIRAVPPGTDWILHYLALYGTVFSLGGLRKREVAFNLSGVSELVDFEAAGDISTATVGIIHAVWKWRYERPDGSWIDFDTSTNRVYLLQAPPQDPWHAQEASADDTQVAWTDALDKSCEWAAGSVDVAGCIKNVAYAINEKPNQSYDVDARNNYLNSDYQFNLTNYLKDWDTAGSFTVDCSNTATALVTFANLLGADLRLAVIKDKPASMSTELVRPLSAPNDDSGWIYITNWSWHEVTFLAGTLVKATGMLVAPTPDIELPGATATITDATLHVDRPNNHFPVLVPLGSASPISGYRDQLLQSGQANIVKPRRHRPVY